MKVYEVCIKPTSDFATSLQGDCLFGHICWQIAHDSELVGEIDDILSDYDRTPFCVVSDPVMRFKVNGEIKYIFPKAFAPTSSKEITAMASFDERKKEYDRRKAAKKAKWMLVSSNKKIAINNYSTLTDIAKELNLEDYLKPFVEYRQSHNSIDRITGTTGTGNAFAPFTTNGIAWSPNFEMAIFIGIRDDIPIKGVKIALERIGNFGYGADATTGKGRFDVLSMREIELSSLGDASGNALYVLSAVVPEKDTYKKVYFEPFIRTGRHGDVKATSEHPFKQPVLKAAAGAVFIPNQIDMVKETYIGTAVKDVSLFKETVEQGYALVIPMKVENVK